MTREEKLLAAIQFKLRVYQSDGQAFENLFSDVMEAHNPNFQRVKPQGNIGDRKNDGFDKSGGIYYQVYAPEDLQSKQNRASTKLVDDFTGLYTHWNGISPIKEFYYVLNDKYKGAYPTLHSELSDIENTYTGIACNPFLSKDLENIFLNLPPDSIMKLLGFVPSTANIEDVHFNSINEVIRHLTGANFSYSDSKIPINPDFEKKIEFNSLSETPANLLRQGTYQVHAIKQYFQLNSDFQKDDLRVIFNNLYQEAVNNYPESDYKPDIIFYDILDKASPQKVKYIQDAVIVLMSYYFEYCDIFKTPPSLALF